MLTSFCLNGCWQGKVSTELFAACFILLLRVIIDAILKQNKAPITQPMGLASGEARDQTARKLVSTSFLEQLLVSDGSIFHLTY